MEITHIITGGIPWGFNNAPFPPSSTLTIPIVLQKGPYESTLLCGVFIKIVELAVSLTLFAKM